MKQIYCEIIVMIYACIIVNALSVGITDILNFIIVVISDTVVLLAGQWTCDSLIMGSSPGWVSYVQLFMLFGLDGHNIEIKS